MGLTLQSVGEHAAGVDIEEKIPKNATVIALAGNPNVGKSTLFNRLTGMKQHTGNWPGKTVTNAVGEYKDKNNHFAFVDIPGTYSLNAHSAEEEVARDFLIFGAPDLAVVVCDATCLERNLNLVLQVMEICPRVLVCVNLLDEARKKGISIDMNRLKLSLGVPVVGTSARKGGGVKEFIFALEKLKSGEYDGMQRVQVVYPLPLENAISSVKKELDKIVTTYNNRWLAIKLLENDTSFIESLEGHFNFSLQKDTELSNALESAKNELLQAGIDENSFKNYLVSGLVLTAEAICDEKTVNFQNKEYRSRDFKIDKILTGKITGPMFMILLLALILWITVSAANYPSQLLWSFFSYLEESLFDLSLHIGIPRVFADMLFHGAFRVLCWVISVMLPPMAIFFPMFTLLEDLGYLPRIAFNLDNGFKKCSACGKQALTMCMGFGCNAAGITGCRIIDSGRERLIAVITNNFVPCNGRFPTLIAIISMFFVGISSTAFGSLKAALILTAVIMLGIGTTFLVSKLLAVTVLKGEPSSFTLELPPYRKPQIGSVIVRSIFDRTVFVLLRAMSVAAPAGLLIWLLANITVNGTTLLSYMSGFLDPFGRLLGMDGIILLGFILGFPANEIVVPIIIMGYMGGGVLTDYSSLFELKTLLTSNGWTATTALCTMVFSLMHWPCSTALITAKKETGSIYWSVITFIVPTLCGMLICFLINLISKLI